MLSYEGLLGVSLWRLIACNQEKSRGRGLKDAIPYDMANAMCTVETGPSVIWTDDDL
jgi:hypothetical protein